MIWMIYINILQKNYCHIEFLYFDNLSNQEKWISSLIEFIEDEYYLYNYKDVSLESLKVRVRRLEF